VCCGSRRRSLRILRHAGRPGKVLRGVEQAYEVPSTQSEAKTNRAAGGRSPRVSDGNHACARAVTSRAAGPAQLAGNYRSGLQLLAILKQPLHLDRLVNPGELPRRRAPAVPHRWRLSRVEWWRWPRRSAAESALGNIGPSRHLLPAPAHIIALMVSCSLSRVRLGIRGSVAVRISRRVYPIEEKPPGEGRVTRGQKSALLSRFAGLLNSPWFKLEYYPG